mmetsp:Transcript_10500/g.29880  ORF Transcript_10500/g.29880 Transcript_10500/m.29880 type:complete len:221 (+) Transcript_10500:1194-1856(+)
MAVGGGRLSALLVVRHCDGVVAAIVVVVVPVIVQGNLHVPAILFRYRHPPVLHGVVRPPLHHLRYLRPPVAILRVALEEDCVLLRAPAALLYVRVQIVFPSPSALLAAFRFQRLRYEGPTLGAVLLHQLPQPLVLLLSPACAHRHGCGTSNVPRTRIRGKPLRVSACSACHGRREARRARRRQTGSTAYAIKRGTKRTSDAAPFEMPGPGNPTAQPGGDS